jgi:hypothetical protein
MNSASAILVLVAFLIGALHMLAPDHWVPLSLLSWQKGWGSRRTRSTTLQLLASHLVVGLLLALVLAQWADGMADDDLLLFSLLLVGAVTIVRVFRFSRLQEAFSSGPYSKRGVLAAWSLLGPAESLIPIVLRSNELGAGFLSPFLAYAVGTLLVGTWLVFWGRSLWNRPLILPRGWMLMQRSAPVIPLLAFVLTGISVWVKLSN